MAGRKFSSLAESVRRRVLANIRTNADQKSDAGDALQEALVRLVTRAPEVLDEAGLIAWLTSVARRCLIDGRRRLGTSKTHYPDLGCTEITVNEDAQHEAVCFRMAVHAAWDGLIEREREALKLRAAGKSIRQIARVLGIGDEAAKKRLQRAREGFKGLLVENGLEALFVEGRKAVRNGGYEADSMPTHVLPTRETSPHTTS